MSEDGFSKIFMCTLCYDQLQDARILNGCSHTYCFNCINNWIDTSDDNTCPLCRKAFIIGEDGLVKNIYIHELMDKVRHTSVKTDISHFCSVHTSKPLEFRCCCQEDAICAICMVNDHQGSLHHIELFNYSAYVKIKSWKQDVSSTETVFKELVQRKKDDIIRAKESITLVLDTLLQKSEEYSDGVMEFFDNAKTSLAHKESLLAKLTEDKQILDGITLNMIPKSMDDLSYKVGLIEAEMKDIISQIYNLSKLTKFVPWNEPVFTVRCSVASPRSMDYSVETNTLYISDYTDRCIYLSSLPISLGKNTLPKVPGTEGLFCESVCIIGKDLIVCSYNDSTVIRIGKIAWRNTTDYKQPWGVRLLPNGNIIVSEYSGSCLTETDSNTGIPVRRFGTEILKNPMGMTVRHDKQEIIVADWGKNQLHVFSIAGVFIQSVCTGIKNSDLNSLNHPYDVTIDRQGTLYVADYTNSRISRFDRSYKALSPFFMGAKPFSVLFANNTLFVGLATGEILSAVCET